MAQVPVTPGGACLASLRFFLGLPVCSGSCGMREPRAGILGVQSVWGSLLLRLGPPGGAGVTRVVALSTELISLPCKMA